MTLDIMPKKELTRRVRQALIDVTGADQSRELIDGIHTVQLRDWKETWQPQNDLSFYTGIDYAWQTFDCWNKWSNSTVRLALNWMQLHHTPRVILDHGAGIGATTAQIAMAFPDAKIWYSNVEGYQSDTAKRLFETLGLSNIGVTDQGIEPHDTLFAIELFEHFKEPLPELETLLRYDQTVIVDGSSFHVDEVGHWDEYTVSGKTVTKKQMRQSFSTWFAAAGFKEGFQIVGGKSFWNRHPRLYVRPERFMQG